MPFLPKSVGTMRQLNMIDKLLVELDTALRTLVPPVKRSSQRPNPGQHTEESILHAEEKRHVAGLMRVNHAGEVAAQALYQGQALTASQSLVKAQMSNAAKEEMDHLAWCEERLNELDSSPSRLNVIWYTGSFFIGALAGLVGDKWSLGFVAETENQVTEHLKAHRLRLPPHDKKTQRILSQMQEDEEHHAHAAIAAGAKTLPPWIKTLMQGVSKIMTQSSYYI